MTEDSRPSHALQVFLCHSKGDKHLVRPIYEKLRADGFDPWFDEINLIPGQDWNEEIKKAVRNSDAVIVCLSQDSINKIGYIQREIKYALEVAEEQPEGSIFIIPLKLERCIVPQSLQRWQWVHFFEPQGYQRLFLALQKRREQLGIEKELVQPPSDEHEWLRGKFGQANRNILHARVSSQGLIELFFVRSVAWYDREGLCIIFHLEPGLNEPTALEHLNSFLGPNKIEWLALVNNLWIVRTDVLRRQIKQVQNYQWLNGNLVLYPIIDYQPMLWNSNLIAQTTITFEVSER